MKLTYMPPSFITFKQAKSLYDKGVRFTCGTDYYTSKGEPEYCQIYSHAWKEMYKGKNPDIPRSQQWEIVEWLLDRHDIWVSVSATINLWFYSISTPSTGKLIVSTSDSHYGTPQEAYSAAFDFILETLI